MCYYTVSSLIATARGGEVSPKSRGRHRKPVQGRPPERHGRYTPPEHRSRYTPPLRSRFRPAWHKAVAVDVIVIGAALFVICEFNWWRIHDYGGHIWYLVGILIAASSLWWFGAFDRPQPKAR
jgi:hypothetical protein